MEILFRPARPEDVEQAIPLIYSSGPEGFNYVFAQHPAAAIDFLRFAYPDGRGFFGYRNHVVATVEGKIVGIGAFYSGNEYNRLSNGSLAQIVRFYGWRCL